MIVCFTKKRSRTFCETSILSSSSECTITGNGTPKGATYFHWKRNGAVVSSPLPAFATTRPSWMSSHPCRSPTLAASYSSFSARCSGCARPFLTSQRWFTTCTAFWSAFTHTLENTRNGLCPASHWPALAGSKSTPPPFRSAIIQSSTALRSFTVMSRKVSTFLPMPVPPIGLVLFHMYRVTSPNFTMLRRHTTLLLSIPAVFRRLRVAGQHSKRRLSPSCPRLHDPTGWLFARMDLNCSRITIISFLSLLRWLSCRILARLLPAKCCDGLYGSPPTITSASTLVVETNNGHIS